MSVNAFVILPDVVIAAGIWSRTTALWERELPASGRLAKIFSLAFIYQFYNHLKLSTKENSLSVLEPKLYHNGSPSDAHFEDLCVNLISQVSLSQNIDRTEMYWWLQRTWGGGSSCELIQ